MDLSTRCAVYGQATMGGQNIIKAKFTIETLENRTINYIKNVSIRTQKKLYYHSNVQTVTIFIHSV